MKKFLKNNFSGSEVKIIYKMCNVKLIKDKVEVIIPFGFVQDNGLISNTYVHFYELLMSIDVDKVIYFNSYNEYKLQQICDEFQVQYFKM